MKKITSLISILLAAIILSSCVYVNTDEPIVVLPPPSTYSITFVNNSSIDVADWYVEKKAGKRFYVNPVLSTPVYTGSESTISSLSIHFYKVCFTFNQNLRPDSYFSSDYVYLDKNVEYRLEQRTIFTRSAANEETVDLTSTISWSSSFIAEMSPP